MVSRIREENPKEQAFSDVYCLKALASLPEDISPRQELFEKIIDSQNSLTDFFSDTANRNSKYKLTLFKQFIDLDVGYTQFGNFKNNPVLAKESFLSQSPGLFESKYLQRNIGYGFRDQLILFLNSSSGFTYSDKNLLDSLGAYDVKNENLHNYYRLLISLGFHLLVYESFPLKRLQEKYGDLDNPSNLELWSVMGFLYSRLQPIDLVSRAEQSTVIDEQVVRQPTNEINLRLQFISALRLVIFFSKTSKNTDNLIFYLDMADKLIEAIFNSNSYSSFERHLLVSRFYRAKGFLYQFQNKESDLITCMNKCEVHANKCLELSRESTTRSGIFAVDNVIGCYESQSRTYEFLKDMELSLDYMHKIEEFDNHESKSKVQIGELYFKLSEFDKAKKYFIEAIKSGPPLYAESWFLLANTYKELGEKDLAMLCLIETLKIHPCDKKVILEVQAWAQKNKFSLLEKLYADLLNEFNYENN
jgi:tetratricopeptide (TPR) repeat protein